ncbi:MAG: hypothetical protein IT429_20725, partial [Gemmataceae bacterium]|nr:hypothetical protein [Gemmataceae bacterium]
MSFLNRHFRNWLDSSSRRCRVPYRRLQLEPLEDRVLLASDFPDVISVGRTLSSWSVADIQDNKLKIDYTVYNQQAEEVSGVLLTTTLEPGVSFADATVLPNRNGQELAWSLGTLAPFGRASVQLTVSFAGVVPLQVDDGAEAFGMVNAAAVNDAANPARLRTDTIDPALLAATPDANWEDPYIQAKAAELNQDANEIFQFLTQEIGYESYVGSLRGARGTLWSEAGNSLDEASLGVALMRASGVPAGYAEGTLSDTQAQELILSMFPEPLRITGFIQAGTDVSDPKNDPQLLAETRDHYWVRLDTGAGMQDADPGFVGASIGQIFTTTVATWEEVPDALRHKVTIRLRRELTSPGIGLLGNGQDMATALEVNFNLAELVGRPITLGFFGQTQSLNSPTFGLTRHYYSPYLLIAGDSVHPEEDELIRGTDFSETITTFPYGLQMLTGLFLEADLIAPNRDIETITITIADRIGLEARTRGSSTPLDLSDAFSPLVTSADLTTLNILAGKQNLRSVLVNNREMTALGDAFQSEIVAIRELREGPEREQRMQELAKKFTGLLISMSRARLAQTAGGSDVATNTFAEAALMRAYFDSPRVHALRTKSNTGNESVAFIMDLLRNGIRSQVYPGQVAEAELGFQLNRGIADTIVESLAIKPEEQAGNLVVATGVTRVFELAAQQGRSIHVITPADRSQLEFFEILPATRIFLEESLRSGAVILAPTGPVVVDGNARFAWFEIDLLSGETIGRLDDGSHGAFAQYAAVEAGNPAFNPYNQFALGALEALVGDASAVAIAKFFAGVYISALGSTGSDQLDWWLKFKDILLAMLDTVALIVEGPPLPPSFKLGFFMGLSFGYFYAADPPVDGFLLSPTPHKELQNLQNGNASLAIGVVPDPLFHIQRNGAEVRTVFRLGIKNTGTVAETYTIALRDVTSGFVGESSVPEITIPPGETAEVGLALRPMGDISAPGSYGIFRVTVTPSHSPGNAITQIVPFAVPEIHGVEFELPTDVPAFVGTPVSVPFTLTSTGNIPQEVRFNIDTKDGMTISGLNDLTLNPGEVVTQTLTLTPDPDRPLSSHLGANITAEFGAQLSKRLSIAVQLVVPGADAIANASAAAERLGNADLANRLDDLSIVLTNLVQDPTSPVFKSQSLAALDSILSLLAIDEKFVAYVDPLAAARDQLAAATATADIQAAILALGAALDDFAVVVTNLARHNFTVDLFPDSGIAQPLLPVNYAIQVQNTGTEATTYNLDVSGLPASVSRQFNTTSLTIAPGQIGAAILTLTQTSNTELLTFAFNVNVSVAGVTPEIRKSTIGTMQARREHVSVTDVIATPPFGNPGTNVAVSAKILNAVNRRQDVRVSFLVRNPSGQQVFASTAVAATLTVQASVLNVALGSLDTTGFAEGQYTVAVSVTDLSGNPIPGGTGQTTLLVGSPISAALTVTPQALPPGTSTVTNTLDITALVAPAEQLKFVGSLTERIFSGDPWSLNGSDVVVNGNYVYFADAFVTITVDVSNPAMPTHVGPLLGFAQNLSVAGSRLVSATPQSGGFALRLFDVANPASPVQRGAAAFPYVRAPGGLDVIGNEAFVSTNLVILGANRDITEQFGDILAIDLTLPLNNNSLDDVLFNTFGDVSSEDEEFGIPRNGGRFNHFGLAAADASTLYAATTTSTGTNVNLDENGNPAKGIVRIIDVSDPTNLTQVGQVEIPGTIMVQGVTIDGNRAYVLGSQGGWKDPFINSSDIGPVGNVVMAVLDISDIRNPTVIGTPTVLNRYARGMAGLVALPGKQFAFGSYGTLTDTPQLYLIDASDPTNLTVRKQIDAPGQIRGLSSDGDYLYAATSEGLFIYALGHPDIPVTAAVQIPNNSGVAVDPGSFNVAPTTIISGPNFDTLVWQTSLTEANPTRSFTWQSTVTALQPGESRPVTGATTLDFVAKGTASQVTLPPREVFAGQVLALTPAAQTVRPAGAAAYTLTVANPTASGVTYDLSVQGVPQAWVALPAQVFVPAGGSVNVPLALTSDPFAPLTEFGFVVSAAVSGVSSSVQGALTLQGAAVLPPVQAEAHGVVVALTPTQAVAGQGTPALYTVRLTNTGSVTETFRLTTDLPAGFTATFGQTVVEVPPGASNFRDVTLTVVPALGTTAGDQPFVVTATSTTLAAVRDTASGTATVVASGVNVALSPASGPPNSPFQLTVTNTGQVHDTFDLSLTGPSALVASLDMSQVTLDSGDFKVVPITTSTVDFALPGPLNLMGVAQSITNPAVRVGAAAALSIPATTGLTAHFDPAARVLPVPGPSSFLLLVENTGNTEDSYTATITRTSGSVTANLSGLDGQPTQTIPVFRLPGLSTGAILVQTNLAAVGQGDVRVQVQSLSDPTRSSIATATVSAVAPADTTPPTSSVAPLPAVSPTTFTVSWSGSDEVGGSGLATFDVFVSDNGGPFTPFLTGTTQTAAAFTGVAGHIYGFSSVATDNAGNRQPTPAAAQASTQVEVPPLPPPSDPPPPSGQRPASLRTTIGVVSPRGGFGQPPATWYLRNSNSPGTPDTAPFAYGFQDWVWLSGDWNGDRVTTLGVFDPVGQFGQPPATWYLRDSNSQGVPDVAPFAYGGPNWIPVAGDWDGDGVTTIGVVEPTTMTWYLKNSNSPGAPDIAPFRYGHPGWIPVVGDWDGDGITTIGVYSPNGGFGQPAATWYLRNSNSPGAPDIAPFAYGSADWVPLAGDWDGDGIDSIGVFDPFGQFGQAAATWYLKNSNSPGAPDYGPFAYGAAGWRPVVGDW